MEILHVKRLYTDVYKNVVHFFKIGSTHKNNKKSPIMLSVAVISIFIFRITQICGSILWKVKGNKLLFAFYFDIFGHLTCIELSYGHFTFTVAYVPILICVPLLGQRIIKLWHRRELDKKACSKMFTETLRYSMKNNGECCKYFKVQKL